MDKKEGIKENEGTAVDDRKNNEFYQKVMADFKWRYPHIDGLKNSIKLDMAELQKSILHGDCVSESFKATARRYTQASNIMECIKRIRVDLANTISGRMKIGAKGPVNFYFVEGLLKSICKDIMDEWSSRDTENYLQYVELDYAEELVMDELKLSLTIPLKKLDLGYKFE